MNQAGCLKCGKQHVCHGNSVDNVCPLVLCDDRSRVCTITGFVLPEVRHAPNEYWENATFPCEHAQKQEYDMGLEVQGVVSRLLLGQRAKFCREEENGKQYTRLAQHMYKMLRTFKLNNPGKMPNVLQILAQTVAQEKYWRFIEAASEDLVHHCARNITLCLLELKSNGARVLTSGKIQDMVCGMLYMLKNGLLFKNRVLLAAIPEVDRCLPHENKIEAYFGISSKVICMTENEVKLIFRESYQTE